MINGMRCAGESISINGTTYNEDNLSGTERLLTENGCDSIIVIDLEYLELNTTDSDIACEGDATGEITTSMSNDELDYQLTISDAAGDTVYETSGNGQFSTGPTLVPGTYTVTLLASDLGCTYQEIIQLQASHSASEAELSGYRCPDEVLIINGRTYGPDNPSGVEVLNTVHGCDSTLYINLSYLSIEANHTDVQCSDESTGAISVRMTDDIPFDLSIYDDSGNLLISESSQVEYNTGQVLKTGTYTVVATSEEPSCRLEQEVQVGAIHQSPEPVYLEELLCAGENLEVNGTLYSADKPEGSEVLESVTGCDSTIHILLEFYQETFAQDDIHKVTDNELVVPVLENDEFDPDAELVISVVSYENAEDVTVDGEELLVSVEDGFTGVTTIEYELCNAACTEVCTRAHVNVVHSHDGYDEDILTPNEDGYNDLLVVAGYQAHEQIPNARINIINRWGQVVYSSSDYHNDWRGDKDGNSSSPLPEGVYYYHLIFNTGASIMGSRSLIR